MSKEPSKVDLVEVQRKKKLLLQKKWTRKRVNRQRDRRKEPVVQPDLVVLVQRALVRKDPSPRQGRRADRKEGVAPEAAAAVEEEKRRKKVGRKESLEGRSPKSKQLQRLPVLLLRNQISDYRLTWKKDTHSILK